MATPLPDSSSVMLNTPTVLRAVPVPEHPTPDVIDAKGDIVMPDTQPNLVHREAFRARQARARRLPNVGTADGVPDAGIRNAVRYACCDGHEPCT